MRVLLLDADSVNGFPNLALMKLSAFHKERGDLVELMKGIPDTAPLERYDKICISCIFFQNKERVRHYAQQLINTGASKSNIVYVGGSGWDITKELPYHIEHIRPDYSLYGLDFSLGFTSRGCIRKCGFCVVPAKEGHIRNHAPISEFLHPEHKKLVLLDNNFLASPCWKENLQFLIDNKIKINFNQGLDIRILTEEQAYLLADTLTYDWHFKHKGLHFAFDDTRYMLDIDRGIQLIKRAGIPLRRLAFYILIGYNSTPEQDIQRITLVKNYGCTPYIMPYNRIKTEWAKYLTRWVNRKYHEFIPFESYKGGILSNLLRGAAE